MEEGGGEDLLGKGVLVRKLIANEEGGRRKGGRG